MVTDKHRYVGVRNLSTFFLTIAVFYLAVIYFMPAMKLITRFEFVGFYLGRFIGFILALILVMNSRFRSILLYRAHVYYILAVAVVLLTSSLIYPEIGVYDVASKAYEIFSCIIIYIIFLRLSVNDEHAKIIIWSLALLALANAVVGVYGSLTGNAIIDIPFDDYAVGQFGYDPISGRSGGIRGENYVGIWNVPALSVGLMCVVSCDNVWKWIAGVLLVLFSFTGITVSLSRGSLVSGIIVLLVGLVIYRRNISKLLVSFLFLCLVFMFSVGILWKQSSYFSGEVAEDFIRRYSIERIYDEQRLYVWNEYMESLGDAFLFGKGPNYISKQVSVGNYVPHNLFLHVLVEYGIIGLSLYVLPFFGLIRTLIYFSRNKEPREDYGRIACATVCGMAAGLFFVSDPFLKLLWIVMGYLQGRVLAFRSVHVVNSHRKINFL